MRYQVSHPYKTTSINNDVYICLNELRKTMKTSGSLILKPKFELGRFHATYYWWKVSTNNTIKQNYHFLKNCGSSFVFNASMDDTFT
jgi:hypothetical protein